MVVIAALNLVVLSLTLTAIVYYTLETRKMVRISSDNLRISVLPGLNCAVVAIDKHAGDKHAGIGNVCLQNHSNRPGFFWLKVRGFRVATKDDWGKSQSELTLLRREPDKLGYYDGSKRRFMQPCEGLKGVFDLDELGTALREGQSVAVETLLWVTGDDMVTNKDDPKVLAYDPKRWVLLPGGDQDQTRIQPIF